MHQCLPCCMNSQALAEAIYHTPRELLHEAKASLLAQMNSNEKLNNRNSICSQGKCVCQDVLLRSMTCSFSNNLPKSTKNCMAPIEYFTEVHSHLLHYKYIPHIPLGRADILFSFLEVKK